MYTDLQFGDYPLVFGNYPRMGSPFGAYDPLADKTVTQITEEMSVPCSAGGIGISRHTLNGIGYLATIGGFLDSIGYPYGFNPEVAARGYPKGAIVSEFSGKTLREYISLKDNNTSTDLPDTIYDDTTNDSWAPLQTGKDYNYFPDFSKGSKIFEKSVSSSESMTVSMPGTGWIDIRRKFVYKNDYSILQKLGFMNAGLVNYLQIGGDGTYAATEDENTMAYDTLCIWASEGESSSRFLPASSTMRLSAQITQKAYSEVEFSMNVQVWFYPLLETMI